MPAIPRPAPRRQFAVALLLAVLACLAGPLRAAQDFSAMVADAETGFILTADHIDAPRPPDLIGRLLTITLGIQDTADTTLSASETLTIQPGRTTQVATALQAIAFGEAGYRAPMTALAARIGHNPELFARRIEAIRSRVGMRGTDIRVVRGADGGPDFEGIATVRDTVRLAVSLLRAHGERVDRVFDPATGRLDETRLWMSNTDDGACLLAALGPRTNRSLVGAMTGAPDAATCFEKTARLIAQADARLMRVAR